MDPELPTIMTLSGLQPISPTTVLQNLLASVAATNPGYTANLPGTLVEDISSTDVASIVEMDSFRVELINSITPYGANAFLLNQLGQIYGVSIAAATTTSVNVVFSGPAGYVIPAGFLVTDGTFQYSTQEAAIISANTGNSLSVTAFGTVSGSWAVLAGTVTQLVTSIPSGFNVTVTNPAPGTPGIAAEDESDFRTRVLQAGLAASQGMPRYLKTLVGQVPGVQQNLISVLQQPTGGWEVIVGGGDTYQVALAIFQGIGDPSTIVGSAMSISNITQANPAVVTTALNHGYFNGQIVTAFNVLGMNQINGVPLTVTIIDEKNFSTGVNTATGYSVYISGGYLTPNLRNNSVSIVDYPDVYNIVFVSPPQQTVAIIVTWNTSAVNFVGGAAVQQLGNPALVAYVNAIAVGQPMNLFELQTTFQTAIETVLAPALLTRMVFNVSINGIGTAPSGGTGIIAGDPESFFFTNSTLVVIEQG
jgi:Baseplate J-like protein/Ubiquitin-activating enzyme E1 FCCH domain